MLSLLTPRWPPPPCCAAEASQRRVAAHAAPTLGGGGPGAVRGQVSAVQRGPRGHQSLCQCSCAGPQRSCAGCPHPPASLRAHEEMDLHPPRPSLRAGTSSRRPCGTKLAEARRAAAEAEGGLLARDTAIQELRYDLEAALQVRALLPRARSTMRGVGTHSEASPRPLQAADRFRRRLSEVTAFSAIAATAARQQPQRRRAKERQQATLPPLPLECRGRQCAGGRRRQARVGAGGARDGPAPRH